MSFEKQKGTREFSIPFTVDEGNFLAMGKIRAPQPEPKSTMLLSSSSGSIAIRDFCTFLEVKQGPIPFFRE